MRIKALGIASALLGGIPAVLVAGAWSPAQAVLTYYIYESGSDVVVKTRGTLANLGTPSGTAGACNIGGDTDTKIYATLGLACTGASATNAKVYNLTLTSGNYS